MHPFLADIYSFIADTLLPVRCAVCKREARAAVCRECLTGFTPPEHQRCIACGRPSMLGLTHSSCQTPHTADQLLAAFNYQNQAVGESIITGKYYFIRDVFPVLGRELATFVQRLKIGGSFAKATATPLPLHRRRKRWRGFNQAEVLAHAFAASMELPVQNTLMRIRATKAQKNLKRDERLKNISGSFALLPAADVHEKHIVLIDDVTTTGSTLAEAARVLKRHGAARVTCLAVAQD